MNRRLSIAATAIVLSAAQPAHAAPLSDAVKKDVQCFILYAAGASESADDTQREAAGMGTMYFMGKLRALAPGLNFTQVAPEELAALQADPAIKAIATACDEEVAARGTDLIRFGTALQKIGADAQTTS